MTRRVFLKVFAGLVGLGGAAGCGGGMNTDEDTLATTSTLRIRVILRRTKKVVRVAPGSTALDAIKQAFSYRRRPDGTTVINGIRGHWRYDVNGIEPGIYAGNYRFTSNCRIRIRRFSS